MKQRKNYCNHLKTFDYSFLIVLSVNFYIDMKKKDICDNFDKNIETKFRF